MTIENHKIKIMIVEDQSIILHALVFLLEAAEDITILGYASNGMELLRLLEKDKPDVVLMDIKMPKMNGIEATRIIDEKMPWVKVIALSMYDHPIYIKEMLKCGAKGFLSKNCSVEELCEGIRSVYAGKTYLCSSVQDVVLRGFSDKTSDDDFDAIRSLTAREVEIIHLLSEGLSTRLISEKLFISEKTVERHKTNLFKKMKIKNTAQLIKVAFENGILLNGNGG